MKTITLDTKYDWPLKTNIIFALNKLNQDKGIFNCEFNFKRKTYSLRQGTTITGAMEYCLYKYYSEFYSKKNTKEKFKCFINKDYKFVFLNELLDAPKDLALFTINFTLLLQDHFKIKEEITKEEYDEINKKCNNFYINFSETSKHLAIILAENLVKECMTYGNKLP